MQAIAIVGLGLIGGSLGLALRRAGFTGQILGVSSKASIRKGIERGAISRGASLEEAAKEVDVIYLSQPIGGILKTIDQLSSLIRQGCLVTDAGSTKSVIVSHAHSRLPAGTFIGGHPLAGKEARGVEAADARLFEARTYVFTPRNTEDSVTPLAGAFVKWIQAVGCTTVFMSPEEHDRIVALTSHLPQLASTALAAALQREKLTAEELDVSGSGLRDMTRLALSSFDIWADIVRTNTTFIDHVLEVYIDSLTKMRENLQTQRLEEMFDAAAKTASLVRR